MEEKVPKTAAITRQDFFGNTLFIVSLLSYLVCEYPV